LLPEDPDDESTKFMLFPGIPIPEDERTGATNVTAQVPVPPKSLMEGEPPSEVTAVAMAVPSAPIRPREASQHDFDDDESAPSSTTDIRMAPDALPADDEPRTHIASASAAASLLEEMRREAYIARDSSPDLDPDPPMDLSSSDSEEEPAPLPLTDEHTIVPTVTRSIDTTLQSRAAVTPQDVPERTIAVMFSPLLAGESPAPLPVPPPPDDGRNRKIPAPLPPPRRPPGRSPRASSPALEEIEAAPVPAPAPPSEPPISAPLSSSVATPAPEPYEHRPGAIDAMDAIEALGTGDGLEAIDALGAIDAERATDQQLVPSLDSEEDILMADSSEFEVVSGLDDDNEPALVRALAPTMVAEELEPVVPNASEYEAEEISGIIEDPDGDEEPEVNTSTDIGAPLADRPSGPNAARANKNAQNPLQYAPPEPDDRVNRPAFLKNTDDEEDRLIDRAMFKDLLTYLRRRMDETADPRERAACLVKIASVHERQLEDPREAFDAAYEALTLSAGDDDAGVLCLQLATRLQMLPSLYERTLRMAQSTAIEFRSGLVAWLLRIAQALGKNDQVQAQYAELERLDPKHPLLLTRAAERAIARQDLKGAKDAIERALDRTSIPKERARLLVLGAQTSVGKPEEQLRQLEAAYRLTPGDVGLIMTLEKNGMAEGRYAQASWALTELFALADTPDAKVVMLLRHAELLEKHFVQRDIAAEKLEEVLRLKPGHPVALASLERCYHALQAWPDLAKTLERRADSAKDARGRLELLTRAAEVMELKMLDAPGAALVLKRAISLDPKNKKVLSELTRLSEKAENWPDVITYRTMLAEQSPSRKQAAQAYVQIGDIMEARARDLLGAKLAYDKAAELDKTNTQAWEAIERMARAARDERRLLTALEERAKYTESPRLRAPIFAELGRVRHEQGDEKGAMTAFEAALKADSSHEAAASYVAERYVSQERFKDALPLVDFLINAQSHDRGDPLLLQGRLRLGMRVAAAMGDVERAFLWGTQAVDLDPSALGPWVDLVDLVLSGKDKGSLLHKARHLLAKLESAPVSIDLSTAIKLGHLELLLSDGPRAAHAFSHALSLEPQNQAALLGMVDACLLTNDFAGASDCKVALARSSANLEDRFKHLVEAGEIWAARARDLGEAERVWEEALAIKPSDHRLLHSLMGVYTEREDWEKLEQILRRIADIQESPERRAKSLFTRAQVIAEKVGDELRGAAAYEEVLAADPSRLDAFEQIVRLLTTRKDWWELERAYRTMIAKTQEAKEPGLAFALRKQLGLVYRDRLGDAERALEAFDAADRIRSTDVELRKMVTELLIVTDRVDMAIAGVRMHISREPLTGPLYADLYDLFLRKHAFDQAWCAVNVLAQLQPLTREQAQFLGDYPPYPMGDVPGQIPEQAWQSHLLHGDLDPLLTRIFAWMTPAVARARHAMIPPEQMAMAMGRPLTPQHTPHADTVRTAFRNAAEILSMPIPEMMATMIPGQKFPVVPALAPFGALQVNPTSIDAIGDTLAFVAGKRLAEQRPELCARAFYPSVSELTGLLATAVRVGNNSAGRDPHFAASDNALLRTMSPVERQGVAQLIAKATQEGAKLDVKRWCKLADLSSSRAGLLLCGDVEQARKALAREPQSPSDPTPKDRTAELYVFAISEQHTELRGAIGTAVGAEE